MLFEARGRVGAWSEVRKVVLGPRLFAGLLLLLLGAVDFIKVEAATDIGA